MINEKFFDKFVSFKNKGINLQYVLDIGAYRGEFTNTILKIWPTAIIRQFEADERQLQYLNENCFNFVLGNENKTVKFYTLDDTKITTGSSIFLENTKHYTDLTTIIIDKPMVTLDYLDQKNNFFGDWKNKGLVKLDVQGSELMVLEGSKNFIANRQPKFILMECPIAEYNLGAPKFDEYISYMKKINYHVLDIFDISYDNYENLLQIDLLFERL
jgi:FkbM family methyltransferase